MGGKKVVYIVIEGKSSHLPVFGGEREREGGGERERETDRQTEGQTELESTKTLTDKLAGRNRERYNRYDEYSFNRAHFEVVVNRANTLKKLNIEVGKKGEPPKKGCFKAYSA